MSSSPRPYFSQFFVVFHPIDYIHLSAIPLYCHFCDILQTLGFPTFLIAFHQWVCE